MTVKYSSWLLCQIGRQDKFLNNFIVTSALLEWQNPAFERMNWEKKIRFYENKASVWSRYIKACQMNFSVSHIELI